MKKSFRFLLIAILAFMMLGMSSCVVEFLPGEYEYKVWTVKYRNYRDFEYDFDIRIDDGRYLQEKLSNDEWYDLDFDSEYNGRYYWDIYEIEDWLYDQNFSKRDSADLADWLVSVKHGYIAVRYGREVYVILR